MANKRESFYDDNAQLTKRGVKATAAMTAQFERILRKASTPRQCMDLERAVQHQLSLAVTLRILHLQCVIMSRRKGQK